VIPPGYTVTRDGRIKGPSGRWLKPSLVSGQQSVCFQVDGKQRRVYVGRVVCEVFHGPPPTPDHVAEHIDGNPLNNHADNLRWTTRAEVAQAQTGRENVWCQGEDHHAAKLTWKEVYAIRDRYARGTATPRDLKREYGVSVDQIMNILRNTHWRDPNYVPPVILAPAPPRRRAPRRRTT
jgi:hypothetical protein